MFFGDFHRAFVTSLIMIAPPVLQRSFCDWWQEIVTTFSLRWMIFVSTCNLFDIVLRSFLSWICHQSDDTAPPATELLSVRGLKICHSGWLKNNGTPRDIFQRSFNVTNNAKLDFYSIWSTINWPLARGKGSLAVPVTCSSARLVSVRTKRIPGVSFTATRYRTHLIIGLCGTSGSQKT